MAFRITVVLVLHTGTDEGRLTEGRLLTVTVTAALLEPQALVAVTLYTMVTVGDTEMLAVVAPLLQL